MERSDQTDKLFAEDTLPYPNSIDGERPAHEEQSAATHHSTEPGSPDDDMLAVEYREDEIQAADPLEHTPSDDAPPDHGSRHEDAGR
ncbi:MAG: hypothetical protein ACR2JW_09495 [Thermomicrobiales bacterium]